MLAPDLEKTQTALTQSFAAAQVITIYAGTLRYVVGPQIKAETFPAWFKPVKDAVAAAVQNGSGWMDDLCIDLTTAVPQTIVAFNGRFQDISDDLINLQTEIEMGSGTATAEQQARAATLFGALKTEIAAIEPAMKADHKRITTLLGAVQSDHDALAAMQGEVSNNIPNGSVISKEITGQLGHDFLDVTPNGPCMVSLSIKSDIAAQIKETAGSHRELLPYLIAQAALADALEGNAKATLAFSQVLNIWGFMEGLVDSAIEDLAMGAAKDVVEVLREAMLDAAQKVWTQLSQTAQSLGQGPQS